MASEESLIVRLEADTANLERGLTRVEGDLAAVIRGANRADQSFLSMSKSTKLLADGVVGLSKAALAAGTALSAMIVLSAKSEQELATLAATAGTTTKNFSALSFAMSQAGIDAQGTADAMNDITEATAEFAKVGSGPFQDFADIVGLTSQEARVLSGELQHLSGEEALLKLNKEMQAINVPAGQMNFALKAISADLAKTTLLFADNGEELIRLKKRYEEVNKQLSITNEQAKDLKDAAESFDLMTAAAGKSSKAISASLAPAFDDFINDVTTKIPVATNLIIDYFNSFKDPEDIKSVPELGRQITG